MTQHGQGQEQDGGGHAGAAAGDRPGGRGPAPASAKAAARASGVRIRRRPSAGRRTAGSARPAYGPPAGRRAVRARAPVKRAAARASSTVLGLVRARANLARHRRSSSGARRGVKRRPAAATTGRSRRVRPSARQAGSPPSSTRTRSRPWPEHPPGAGGGEQAEGVIDDDAVRLGHAQSRRPARANCSAVGIMWGRALSWSEMASRSKKTAPGMCPASKIGRAVRAVQMPAGVEHAQVGIAERAARSAVGYQGRDHASSLSSPRRLSGPAERQLDHIGAPRPEPGLAIGRDRSATAAGTARRSRPCDGCRPRPPGTARPSAAACRHSPGRTARRCPSSGPPRSTTGCSRASEGSMPPGKTYFWMKSVRRVVLLEQLVLDGDDLQAGPAAGLQDVVDLVEIGAASIPRRPPRTSRSRRPGRTGPVMSR